MSQAQTELFTYVFDHPTADNVRSLPPDKFDTFIAYLFNRDHIYHAIVVDGPSDGGIDIELRLLTIAEPRLVGVAQCKRFKQDLIGPNLIQSFVTAKHNSHAERGYFFTTSRYTPAAYK